MRRGAPPLCPSRSRLLSCLSLLILCCLSLWSCPSLAHGAATHPDAEGHHGAELGLRHDAAEEPGICAVFPFPLFLAATMGRESSTHALTTCGTTPFSGILQDVALSHLHRDATDSVVDRLWSLTHGNADPLAFFDNAHVFLALRAEMEAWIRANRTVGMGPSAYEAVVRGVGAVLGMNDSLFEQPTVPLPPPETEEKEEAFNWTQRFARCENGTVSRRETNTCVYQVAQDAYRVHANATLRTARSSSLLVSNTTFTRAQRYYEHAVFPSIIVRAMDLDPQTTASGFDRHIHGLLRGVQLLWDAVADDVAAQAEALSSPFLPLVQETDFTGPRRRETYRGEPEDFAYPSPSRYSGSRLQALRRHLPAAVVYQTGAHCRSCRLFDQAFELLPAVYKRMCSRGYRSIVSCSPVTLFLRTTYLRPFQRLPSLELYARQVHSRAAVLRLAELKLLQLSQGDAAASAEADADDADDAADFGDDMRPNAFYSLRTRYEKSTTGLEEALLPRSHFEPMRRPLRPHPEVTTVEEAVVSLVGDLVGTGVIQFLFLDPSEVARIARENARVTRMVEEQQARERAARAEGSNDTAEAAPATNAGAPPPSSSPNPEDHPQYRKVVSFRDLSTKLVQAHTRALFGEVDRVGNKREGRFAGVRVPALLRCLASLWWLVELPRAVWELFLARVDRLLFVAAFALLCLYQHRWNRSQRVSYW